MSAPQRVDQTSFSTSSATTARDGGVADVGVDLDEEVAADRHRLGLGVVDVRRDDGAAAGDLVADEFGGDVVGDARAEVLAVALLGDVRPADVLADRDIFHLGRDDAAPGIGDLGHGVAGLRAQRVALDVGEGLGVGAGVERRAAGEAIVLGLDSRGRGSARRRRAPRSTGGAARAGRRGCRWWRRRRCRGRWGHRCGPAARSRSPRGRPRASRRAGRGTSVRRRGSCGCRAAARW